MKAIILKCTPYSQFHFGQVAVDADTSLNDSSDFIHSDTLFSAIVNIASKAFPGDVNRVLALLGYGAEEPTLRLSSAFYCLESGGEMLYFLPKPLNSQLTIAKEHKQLKKIQFISKGVWESKLKPDEWLKDKGACKIIQKTFVVTNDEFLKFGLQSDSKLYSKEALPKVAIHKETKENSFYYQTNIQINALEAATVHFYFLMEGWEKLNATEKSIMDIVFKMLPKEGIGGERTTGCGIFSDLIKKDFSIQSESANLVTLSLVNPKSKDEFAAFQQYDIIRRGGRRLGVALPNTSGSFLKRINMILEGAVINQKVDGRIQDITPDEYLSGDTFIYLRSGIGFSLPY